MNFQVSPKALLTAIIVLFPLVIVVRSLFSRTPFGKGKWQNVLFRAVLVSAVANIFVGVWFYLRYGWVTDDVNYFGRAGRFLGKSFFDIRTGNEYMYFVTNLLKVPLRLDIPSFHVVFGFIGIVASLLLLFIYQDRVNMKSKADRTINTLAVFTLLCFPNIVAWGHFYGKDSTMFFLAAVFCTCVYLSFVNGLKASYVVIMGISFVNMLYLRAPIAGAILMSYFAAMLVKNLSKSRGGAINIFAVAGVVIVASVLFTIILQRTTKTDTMPTAEQFQQTLVQASNAGASGGSATDYASEVTAGKAELSFKLVLRNFSYVAWAPLPWQIRGSADIVAFVANVLLAILFVKYRRPFQLSDPFQMFLLITTLSLSLVVTVAAVNIGLVLRQKTIILPFLFLLIFGKTVVTEKVRPRGKLVPMAGEGRMHQEPARALGS
jgi:hypothetical protein